MPLQASQNVFITCAVTGSGGSQDRSPHVPRSPEQIANSAIDAAKAGAAIVHCHVRDPDTGEPSRRPELYRELLDRIRDSDTDVVINFTAGMGGGTGTGAAPVVAQIAKELGILTVAVVTRPFNMEGNKRSVVADMGMSELAKHVDSLITIPNQKLLTVLGPKTTLLDAFKSANGVLQGAVQGIAELITRPGLINVDFADVRTVMSETGMAMMGTGVGAGEGEPLPACRGAGPRRAASGG